MVCNDMLQQDASGEVVAAARTLSGSGGSSQDFLYSPPLPSARWRDVSRQPRHCLYSMPRMQHADHDADAGMCRGNGYCIKQGQNSEKLTHRSDMTVATRPTGLR